MTRNALTAFEPNTRVSPKAADVARLSRPTLVWCVIVMRLSETGMPCL